MAREFRVLNAVLQSLTRQSEKGKKLVKHAVDHVRGLRQYSIREAAIRVGPCTYNVGDCVVDVGQTTFCCSRGCWGINKTDLPCEHARAAISAHDKDIKDPVWYHSMWHTGKALEVVTEALRGFVCPTTPSTSDLYSSSPRVLPPVVGKAPGRTAVNRLTSESASARIRRFMQRYHYHCTLCGDHGHFAKTCRSAHDGFGNKVDSYQQEIPYDLKLTVSVTPYGSRGPSCRLLPTS